MMDLEIIILSIEKYKYHTSLICVFQNMTQINISMKQNQTHRCREQTHCLGRGGGGGREGNNWEVGVSR